MLLTIFQIFGSGLFLGVFGWAIQLGNRVIKLETQQPDLERLINAQFADVGRRLDRIERAMNGSLHKVDNA